MTRGRRDARLQVGAVIRPLHVDASLEATSADDVLVAQRARFDRTKMDELHGSIAAIRSTLTHAMVELHGTTGYLALDEFHHLPFADQPKVLAYLHQLVKGLEIYLKVCGVRHRLNPFVEGSPPLGLQIGQDANQKSHWT
jgi:hypothetical protein